MVDYTTPNHGKGDGSAAGIEELQIDTDEDDAPGKKFSQALKEKQHYILLVTCIVVVIVVTLAITFTVTVKNRGKPHVVMIVADDMGHNDIGYYNQHDDIRTPYLDKMAKEGVRLDRYYGQSVCTPARAALMTGRYPYRYGLQGARPALYGSKTALPATENQLISQVMKSGGYKTYLVGKWHLGFAKWADTPVKRGFDYFYGMYGGFADYFKHTSAEPEGKLQVFDLHELHLNPNGTISEVTQKNKVDLIESTYNVYSERLFTDKATDIIKNHEGDEPMFLMVCFMNPHSPLQTLPEDDARVPGHVNNTIRKKFSALMSSLDYGVQQIAETLKVEGMYDNTIFIFTGDNGGTIQGYEESESLGGTNYPLRGSKWTIWEGGVKVPAFVRGPNIPENVVSNGLFHITDWLPTLASLAKVKPIKDLDGVDQTGMLTESKESNRREIVVELDTVFHQAAIIRDNFKLYIGDPGARAPFSGVYPPLIGNATWYFDKTEYTRKMYAEFQKKSLETQLAFMESVKDTSFNFRNVSLLGEFSTNDVRLYDIELDVSESYDLFTDQHRFEDIARDMYNTLVANLEQMAEPLFFVGDTMDKPEAYEGVVCNASFTMKKWHPWL